MSKLDIDELEKNFIKLKDSLEFSIDCFKEDFKGLREDFKGLKKDFKGLKEDCKGLKEDFKGLKEDFCLMKKDIKMSNFLRDLEKEFGKSSVREFLSANNPN